MISDSQTAIQTVLDTIKARIQLEAQYKLIVPTIQNKLELGAKELALDKCPGPNGHILNFILNYGL